MPLVDITVNPDYRFRQPWELFDEGKTRVWLSYFAGDLPNLLVRHADELGLDSDTPPEGIQVMMHDYGARDVNIADVWIKVQFSEECPEMEERLRIRDQLYGILAQWFHRRNLALGNFVMDIFWGPTNGRGTVSGVEIEW